MGQLGSGGGEDLLGFIAGQCAALAEIPGQPDPSQLGLLIGVGPTDFVKEVKQLPRVARVVIPEVAHHVTQRGTGRQMVFYTRGDRVSYLRLLKENCERAGLRILAYCLMPNHIHLIAAPREAAILWRFEGNRWRMDRVDGLEIADGMGQAVPRSVSRVLSRVPASTSDASGQEDQTQNAGRGIGTRCWT